MSDKQSGFTLIEIVMMLVLLGILSAVAVPKYFDMQEKAMERAAKATVAELQARINARFASELLAGKSCTEASGAAAAEISGDFGDWELKVSQKDASTNLLNVDEFKFKGQVVSFPNTLTFTFYGPVCKTSR